MGPVPKFSPMFGDMSRGGDSVPTLLLLPSDALMSE